MFAEGGGEGGGVKPLKHGPETSSGVQLPTRRASVKSFVAVGQALVALVVGAACGGVITASAT